MSKISAENLLLALKAAGEPTRLRILALLSEGELNVKDLTRILGQSQPRISRHLKLMSEAGLIERFREGSWVYFRLSDNDDTGKVARDILGSLDEHEPELIRDKTRAAQVKQERSDLAQQYFRDHAAEWDKIRSLHLSESDVEQAMLEVLGDGPFDLLVDLGTGTGRMLELFSGTAQRGIGIDMNPDMLAYARSRLQEAGYAHCQVRYGDIFNLPLDDEVADVVILHQVLHFLEDPMIAVMEAERVLSYGGRLLIVDFAQHELEYLREDYAHLRLGFSRNYLKQCLEKCGLSLDLHRDLEPSGEKTADKLTVSLWLARKKEEKGLTQHDRSTGISAGRTS